MDAVALIMASTMIACIFVPFDCLFALHHDFNSCPILYLSQHIDTLGVEFLGADFSEFPHICF